MDQELDSWTKYVTCKWIDNPDPSPTRPMPDSPDLISDSEPICSTAVSGEETGNNEEDLASVPSTVHVGSLGSSGREGNARPIMSPGGN